MKKKARRKREEAGRRERPHLNNFHAHLPGGLYRTIFDPAEPAWPREDARASRKLRGMTRARFHALIDGLIAELGLDAGEIERLQRAGTGKIYDYVFPLYVRLREEGFKHYPDLTA